MTASRQPPRVTTEVHQIFHAPPNPARRGNSGWGLGMGIGDWELGWASGIRFGNGYEDWGWALRTGMGVRIGDGHWGWGLGMGLGDGGRVREPPPP